MPRKKKKNIEQMQGGDTNSTPQKPKTHPVKRRLGYWLTVLFALVAALSFILSSILPVIA